MASDGAPTSRLFDAVEALCHFLAVRKALKYHREVSGNWSPIAGMAPDFDKPSYLYWFKHLSVPHVLTDPLHANSTLVFKYYILLDPEASGQFHVQFMVLGGTY